jgi:hypothetical protein
MGNAVCALTGGRATYEPEACGTHMHGWTVLAPCQPQRADVDWCGADPTLLADDAPRTGVETARLWALEMGLRAGSTKSLRPSAVELVVVRWAEARGWSPPPLRAVGHGLAAAGIRINHARGERRLLLHRDDAARLRKLVWEAWAPRVPPGERPKRREQRLPLQCALARLEYLKPPPPGFHAQLAREGGLSRAVPVVDSRGRCYPSVAYAARSLVAKREKDKAPARLVAAMRKDGHWRGLVWRRLLPQEVALVPQGAPCGFRIEALSWQYACQRMGLLTRAQFDTVRIGTVARDDDREG